MIQMSFFISLSSDIENKIRDIENEFVVTSKKGCEREINKEFEISRYILLYIK